MGRVGSENGVRGVGRVGSEFDGSGRVGSVKMDT